MSTLTLSKCGRGSLPTARMRVVPNPVSCLVAQRPLRSVRTRRLLPKPCYAHAIVVVMAPPLRVTPLAMGVAVLLAAMVAVSFATAVTGDRAAAGGDAPPTCAAPAGAPPASAAVDGAFPTLPVSGGGCGCGKGKGNPLLSWAGAPTASLSQAKGGGSVAAAAASSVPAAPATGSMSGCLHCAAAAAAGGNGGRCGCPHCVSAAGKAGGCGCGCPHCAAAAAVNDSEAGGCSCPLCAVVAGKAGGGCKCDRCAAAAAASGKPGACTCPHCVAAAVAAASGAPASGCACAAAVVAGGENAGTGAACGCPHCATGSVSASGGSGCGGCNHPGCLCRAAAAARAASTAAGALAASGSPVVSSVAAGVTPAAGCGCSRCNASGTASGRSGKCGGCARPDCPCHRATLARLSVPVGHLTPPPPTVTLTPTELDGDWAADLLVVGLPASDDPTATVSAGGRRVGRPPVLRLPVALESLDARLGGALAAALGSSPSFRGAAGSRSPTVILPPGGPVLAAMFVGLGPPVPSGCTGCAAPPTGIARSVGEAAATTAASLDATSVGVWTPDMAMAVAGVATGVTVGSWVDRRFKGSAEAVPGAADADSTADSDASADSDTTTLRQVLLLGAPSGEASAAVTDRSAAIGRGVVLARQLVGGPPNAVTPAVLTGAAATVAAMGDGWRLVVLDADDAAAVGMGAFNAVAAGGGAPARFIHLAWTPPRGVQSGRAVALVGKGVTFDTGGYNIKLGAASMLDKMKVCNNACECEMR